jgi:hypothetical protein
MEREQTEQGVAEDLKKFREYVTASPERARECLQMAGIVDENGKLTPPYDRNVKTDDISYRYHKYSY